MFYLYIIGPEAVIVLIHRTPPSVQSMSIVLEFQCIPSMHFYLFQGGKSINQQEIIVSTLVSPARILTPGLVTPIDSYSEPARKKERIIN